MSDCGHVAHMHVAGQRYGAKAFPVPPERGGAPMETCLEQGAPVTQQEFIGPAHPNYQGPKAVHTAYDYAVVEILRVVDGDTVDARVETGWEDKGFHVEVKTRTAHRFRLVGVDTPERGQPGWAEATEFTRAWLVGPLRVRTHKSDNFGRWLGDFYDPGSGRTLGAALIEAGHARVWPA